MALGFSLWEVFPPGIWHDDGVYVLLGRALAHGDGLRYVGVVGEPLAPKFPPLFPLLLAGIWTLVPSFPENVPLLAGVNLVLMAVAAGLFAEYLRRVLALSLPLALGITLLAWLSPHLWRFALIPLSEPLYLLTLVGALWAGGRAEEEGRGGGSVVLFLAAAGLAVMTRTVGVAVLLAGVAGFLAIGRKRASGGVLLGSVVVLLPWILWSRRAAATIPSSLQDTLGPYGGWWIRQMIEAPGDTALFVLGNGVNLTGRVLGLLLPAVSGPPLWLGLILIPPILVGLLEIAGRTRILPFTLLFSLGILLAWPFEDIRLVTPLHPFLVLAAVLGFRALAGREEWPLYLRRAVAGLGGLWVVLLSVMSVVRLAEGWPAEPFRTRAEALVSAVQAVSEHTPADAVVGAPELWPGIGLFTGRTVAPSAPFHPLAGDQPTWGTPDQQYRLWVETGVTHILVEHGGRVHGAALDRVDALCPGTGVQLLVNRPGQFLVRLGWDQACRDRLFGGGG